VDEEYLDLKAARNALDQKRVCDARRHLKAVDSGMLQAAAKMLLQRVDSVRDESGR